MIMIIKNKEKNVFGLHTLHGFFPLFTTAIDDEEGPTNEEEASLASTRPEAPSLPTNANSILNYLHFIPDVKFMILGFFLLTCIFPHYYGLVHARKLEGTRTHACTLYAIYA